jgi:hypothetical protein
MTRVKAAVDRLWPLAHAVPSIPLADMPFIETAIPHDIWSGDSTEATSIDWTNWSRSVPGKTTLAKWTNNGRTFYRVHGPVDPDYSPNSPVVIVCQVYFLRGTNAYRWDAVLEQGCIVCTCFWDQITQRVPSRRVHSHVSKGTFTLTFWMAPDERLGNIVYYYYEGEYAAWLATELPGTQNHDNLLRWGMP